MPEINSSHFQNLISNKLCFAGIKSKKFRIQNGFQQKEEKSQQKKRITSKVLNISKSSQRRQVRNMLCIQQHIYGIRQEDFPDFNTKITIRKKSYIRGKRVAGSAGTSELACQVNNFNIIVIKVINETSLQQKTFTTKRFALIPTRNL